MLKLNCFKIKLFETAANEQEQFNQKINEEVPCIRKADLENHNKDGGLWIVIHGKVYDVQEFKTQAACGRALLEQYSGQFNRDISFYAN